ncbi:MAG: DUF4260 family protein [bacterium]|nr:DUF4260 family protein [bacterium]
MNTPVTPTTPMPTLPPRTGVRLLLYGEGLALFAAAIALYIWQQGSGLAFIALLLAPDLAALGYFINPRIGSYTYNAVHTLILPLIGLAFGLTTANPTVTQLMLIWLAHIGMDRTVGYGLKYPAAFKLTHLQKV